jgi:hypothetical protein
MMRLGSRERARGAAGSGCPVDELSVESPGPGRLVLADSRAGLTVIILAAVDPLRGREAAGGFRHIGMGEKGGVRASEGARVVEGETGVLAREAEKGERGVVRVPSGCSPLAIWL